MRRKRKSVIITYIVHTKPDPSDDSKDLEQEHGAWWCRHRRMDRDVKLPPGLGEWEMTCALSGEAGEVSGIAASGDR